MSSSVCSCSRERGVWLGLSDVNSAGKLRWVNGSEAREGEEGLPPRSPVARGNLCVSLDQRGQTSSHPCNAKRAYVCQYNPQGRLQIHGKSRNTHLHTHKTVDGERLHILLHLTRGGGREGEVIMGFTRQGSASLEPKHSNLNLKILFSFAIVCFFSLSASEGGPGIIYLFSPLIEKCFGMKERTVCCPKRCTSKSSVRGTGSQHQSVCPTKF